MTRTIPIVMAPGSLAQAAHAHTSGDITAAQAVPGPAPVWITVAGRPISEADIAREMQFHRALDPHAARLDAARALVVRELLRLECERLGLDAVEREGDETFEEARIRCLLDRETIVPEPDEAACRRYFDNNRDHLRGRDRLRVHHILLAASAGDSHERLRMRDLGEQLIAQLREDPARFAEFACRYSDCPSKESGGDLGWIEPGDTTPEFERQVFRLTTGLAGLTVESRWGHHIVRVDAKQCGQPLEFEQTATRIASYLQAQARQHAVHQYLRALHQRYEVRGLDT